MLTLTIDGLFVVAMKVALQTTAATTAGKTAVDQSESGKTAADQLEFASLSCLLQHRFQHLDSKKSPDQVRNYPSNEHSSSIGLKLGQEGMGKT